MVNETLEDNLVKIADFSTIKINDRIKFNLGTFGGGKGKLIWTGTVINIEYTKHFGYIVTVNGYLENKNRRTNTEKFFLIENIDTIYKEDIRSE